MNVPGLTAPPQSVIFDFDGVLVDTEWAIYRSWQRVFESEGFSLPLNIFNQCIGSGYTHWNPAEYLESLTHRTYDWPVINAKRQQEIHADLLKSGLMPGALDLLDYCRAQNLPIAVASSSTHSWVDGWLTKLQIRDRFCQVLCRDDGLPVKPDPALYHESAKRLHLSASRCLVIEDSANGSLAAIRAGLPVVVIPSPITVHASFHSAVCRLNSLTDVISLLQHTLDF